MSGVTQREEVKAGSPSDKPDFFPIHLAVMQPGTTAPVDLYIRQGEPPRFVLYKASNTPLTDEIRERLIANQVEELYMRKEDEAAFYRYVEEQISSILKDDALPIEHAWPVVYEVSSRVTEELLGSPRSGERLLRTCRMAESVVYAISQSREPLQYLAGLISHDYYTYTHSVQVCVILVAASREVLGLKDRRELKEIGRGALLHDIGKSEIPREILSKPGKLTEAEFEKVKEHPLIGFEIANRRLTLSADAAAIIRSHHERFDGNGYPDGLAGEDISPVVRLATLADVYDALTTNRSYASALSSYDALAVMVKEMKGHFDVALLRSFIQYLGPLAREDAAAAVQSTG